MINLTNFIISICINHDFGRALKIELLQIIAK
jgi:hypothetical protein